MDDPQAKVRLECIKVTIVMKQLMVRFNAEGCDEAVDRSTNCNASIAKRAVVSRRIDCNPGAAAIENRKLQQIALKPSELSLRPYSLQDFAEDEASKPNFLPADCVL